MSKKHYGAKCKYCDSTETYLTEYIGMSSPNVRCDDCGAEYFVSPTFRLEVRDTEVDVKGKHTGFKDKNKNEIHFGDKLRCWIKDSVEPEGGFYWYGIVEWFNGCTVVKEEGFDYSDSIFPEDYTFLFQDTEDYEIIND